VAATWTVFIARCAGVKLPWTAPAAMFVAVWMLYAADRLLDARWLDASSDPQRRNELEARHLFHHRHRTAFLAGIGIAAVVLAWLLPSLSAAALGLYGAEGVLLCAWFTVLHATRSAHRLPKEIAVGLFFAAATFIPTVARDPSLRPSLLAPAVLFGLLCSLNCLYIYAWEHDSPAHDGAHAPHTTTRIALRHLTTLTLAAAGAGVGLALLGGGARGTGAPRTIALACVLSAGVLLGLDRTRHRNRNRLARTTLRAAADLALLTPLAMMVLLR
jgi:hypothetical protein